MFIQRVGTARHHQVAPALCHGREFMRHATPAHAHGAGKEDGPAGPMGGTIERIGQSLQFGGSADEGRERWLWSGLAGCADDRTTSHCRIPG